MEIVLLEKIRNLGDVGQVVNVKKMVMEEIF